MTSWKHGDQNCLAFEVGAACGERGDNLPKRGGEDLPRSAGFVHFCGRRTLATRDSKRMVRMWPDARRCTVRHVVRERRVRKPKLTVGGGGGGGATGCRAAVACRDDGIDPDRDGETRMRRCRVEPAYRFEVLGSWERHGRGSVYAYLWTSNAVVPECLNDGEGTRIPGQHCNFVHGGKNEHTGMR